MAGGVGEHVAAAWRRGIRGLLEQGRAESDRLLEGGRGVLVGDVEVGMDLLTLRGRVLALPGGGAWSGVGCTPSTVSPSTTTECQPAKGPSSVSSTAPPPSIEAQNSASAATSAASRTIHFFVMRIGFSSGASATSSQGP